MARKNDAFLGSWRIVHMDEWDDDFLHLVAPAFIAFDAAGQGEFRFGTISGKLACRYRRGGAYQPRVEFSWEGENDEEPSCGGGSATVRPDGSLAGYFDIHSADDFAFVARRG